MRNPLRRSTGPAQDLSAVFRGVRTRGRRRVRRWHLIALALVILIGALGGWAAWFYFSTQAGIHASIPDVQKESEGKPFNVLLVGSDSRKGLTEKEQQSLGAADVGSQRSDTIILAHVDPDTDHVTMVQFPRDLYVEIPGHGKNKINTAYIHGRRTLVKTIEHLSGLPINHYVEVNIAGFRALVNAIEGVDVCVPEVIPFDSNTGIAIEEPGMYHFDGDAALRFVRSRHTIATGDIGRIANQQKFLSAALDKLTSTGTFFHLARVLKLKPIAEKYVTTDEGTTILGLWRIAKRLRSFDPEKYEAYVAPFSGFTVNEAGDVEVPNTGAMKKLFDALAKDESPAEADGVPNLDPAAVGVGVYNATFHNGTVEEGAAGKVAAELQAATRLSSPGSGTKGPVNVTTVSNARRYHATTLIRYKPGAQQKASLVSAAMPGVRLEEGKTPNGEDVAVLVGTDSPEVVQLHELSPIPIPKRGRMPSVCRQTASSPLTPTVRG